MNDRQAQFLIAVGDLCAAAALADLPVEIVTGDGARVRGPVIAIRTTGSDDEVDHTGYARNLAVDDSLLHLDDVVECTIRAPSKTG